MRQELDLLIGCPWGEQHPQRSGYRNGYYERDLFTNEGLIEDLKVPRDREGRFQTQVFDRYQRHEPRIQEGITKMYVAGVSTHKVAEVTETLLGTAPSASTVSRLNQTLEQQFQAWRERPLKPHYRFLYLDGVYYDIRHQDQVDRTVLLTALAVDLNGNKEVLSFLASAEETKEGWLNLLTDVRKRGAIEFDLILSDGHDGLLAAVLVG
jgi:transposase-like protein